jgi:hypothetical protein
VVEAYLRRDDRLEVFLLHRHYCLQEASRSQCKRYNVSRGHSAQYLRR